jgi:glycosyltransferase involved in cell wall biosynthesis
MKITYITAGAAGMYCGSCMHDNTLVAALIARGHDALLVPTYTPIRTDEIDVSSSQIFFGGINVYLQQKVPLFRHTPWLFDRLLNARWLLRWVSRFAAKTQAEELGELTISMLKGEHGYQKKEIAKLVYWLKQDIQPDILNLTNVLLSGMVPRLKAELKRPILGTLQGDDIFLEMLPDRYRQPAMQLIRDHCRDMDGFIATSVSYADFMADYFQIPRSKIDVIYPGLNLKGHDGPRPLRSGEPFTIGYFARICPEKGLHNLVAGFRLLKQQPGLPPCRLRVSGWLGDHNKSYLEDLKKQLTEANLIADFEYVDCPDHASKVRFLQSIDVLSVPTSYREPKGLYVLEAWANGIPAVQPRHGTFPELIEATGGGLLVEPEDAADLARGLRQMIDNAAEREEMGRRGQQAVRQRFHADVMADTTLALYQKYLL